MELKKHHQELTERLYLLDEGADDQLSMELIELHEKKCKDCQEDRLSCTVRPACKDRNFLNMMIELGVEPQDLPAFCYSQHLEQIRRFILEKKGRGMVDRRIPIKDLLSILKVSSIRQFTTRFTKEWETSVVARDNNLMLVAGDELRFFFDFSRGQVVLNPIHVVVKDFELAKLYVNLLGEFYGLESSIEDFTLKWWIIRISTDHLPEAKARKALKDRLSDNFEAIFVEENDKGLEIHVEIVIDERKEPLIAGNLEQLFRLVSRLRQSESTK